ncbi:MipA/OmpV family protein [Colwellia sp. 12G3]|uniref:MipA/OmpV family protein n=1 Tax=Colwellia sp. 12G3 TaxID=2058299 RepID=UPI001E48DE0C|nr:MipA/OmpV family protein [Colwellia sp. 12G3]
MPFKKNNIRRIHNKSFSWLLVLSLLLFSSLSYGQDTSEIQDHNDNKPVIKDEFEWQFLLDLSFVYDPKIIAGIEQEELLHYFIPGLLIDISYKGFFLQTNQRRSSVLLGSTEFGYQLVVEDNWQLDLIAKAYMQGYDSESLIEYGGGDDELLKGLRERDATIGIAVRYSHYLQDSLFTIDFAYGSSSDDVNGDHVGGLIIDSFYSYLLPYKNWDIYFGAGLTYFNQDIVNHYIGVGSDEVTDIRPAYTASAGFRGQAELYAQYPLSASWSFQAGMTHSIFSNDVKKSPLVNTNQVTQVMLGVLYVF